MNLESLAKEATQRAKGDAAMVEVPKVEGVMRERRNRHRAKQAIAGTVVVVVFAVVVAAAIAMRGNTSSTPVTRPKIDPAVEIRVVNHTLPYAAGAAGQATCESGALITPLDKIPTTHQVILPGLAYADGKPLYCYRLGPILVGGASIATVKVGAEFCGGYPVAISLHTSELARINRAANKRHTPVALVFDNVVQSTAGPPFHGEFGIGFSTKDAAVAFAAKVLGVKRSRISVPPTSNQLQYCLGG